MKFCPKCEKMLSYNTTSCQNCNQQEKIEQTPLSKGIPASMQKDYSKVCEKALPQASVISNIKVGGVELNSLTSVTGIGAVALIILLYQRLLSFPILRDALHAVNFLFGAGHLQERFSFYELASNTLSLHRAVGEQETWILFLIAGGVFVLSAICMLNLGLYLYGLAKKASNIEQKGKRAYMLTFSFTVVVWILGTVINRVIANEIKANPMLNLLMDTRPIAFAGTFYLLMLLAGLGWYWGFKERKSS